MKKDKKDLNGINMRDEYDFSKGVRGKHYKSYREGHTVIIHKDDGTKSIQYFILIYEMTVSSVTTTERLPYIAVCLISTHKHNF